MSKNMRPGSKIISGKVVFDPSFQIDSSIIFQVLSENIPDIVAIVDQGHIVRYLNRVPEGMDGKALVGKEVTAGLFQSSQQSSIKTSLDSVFTSGLKSLCDPVPMTLADDETAWYQVIMSPVRNKGQVVAAMLILRNITGHTLGRKKLEEVKARKANYKAFMATSRDGFWLIDSEERIIELNEAYTKMTGFSREEIIGRKLSEFEAKDAQNTLAGRMETILKSGSDRFETRHIRKGKPPLEVEVTVNLQTNFGKVFVAIIRDITGERAKRKLIRYEAMGTMAAGMAHEFNNVLQGIMGFAAVLQQKPDVGAEESDCLKQIFKGCNRGASITRRVLSFGSREMSRKSSINLGRVADETLQMLKRILPPAIDIKSHLDKDISLIHADPVQINQVLVNLCLNGAQAMEGKGVLEMKVGACAYGGWQGADSTPQCADCLHFNSGQKRICALVSDTGHGIDPKVSDKIFEPFFTTKPEGVGSGLGLSLALGIINEHNGYIFASSAPGKGARFFLSFPALDEKNNHAEKEQDEAPKGQGQMVLYVDDEEMITTGVGFSLEALGYGVEVFNSPQKAIGAFMKNPEKYDLVVTDQMMPQMTGLELASAIKAIRKDIPILLSTGQSGGHSEQALANMGITGILEKPISIYELSCAIDKALAR